MNQEEISKIQALDPNGCYGTIQSVLFMSNLDSVNYADALYHLLKQVINEREHYLKYSQRLENVIKDGGLDLGGILGLG